ncbi:MAG: DUF502 domain-containing protein [Phycisphaerae bacterium]|nr:DUF502 domain-containing protein [Phycisphaerae bacterium]
MDDFRRFFLRGLAALVPTLLTFAILVWVYQFVDGYVGRYITNGLLEVCRAIRDEPARVLVDREFDALRYGTPIDRWDERTGQRLTIEYMTIHSNALVSPNDRIRGAAFDARSRALWEIAFRKFHLHVLGFVIAIILVYFTGMFLASFMGRTMWRMGEGVLKRIPVIRAVYTNVKQVTDFLLTEKPLAFSGMVAVQYPRLGVWSLGLSTGQAIKAIQGSVPEELVTVFIPSSPTPMTGYVVHVARRDVIDLNISVDEALRFIISGGVIKPGAMIPSEPVAKPEGVSP